MPDKEQKLQCDVKSIVLLMAVALIIIVRRPEFFIYPRFWAEEGADYFAQAWNHGIFAAITSQHFGYYAIIPTISTALATLVPVESAPLVTTITAAFFQLAVSAIIIFGNSPFWDTWAKKCLLAILVQLINPFEVWLTTIATQYWMTIAVFLILLEQKEDITPLRKKLYRGVVLVGGLSGAQPLFLFPAYLLKAWRSRQKEEYVLTGLLFFAGIVQVVAFGSAAAMEDPYMKTRFGSIAFDLDMFLTWHFVEPYFSLSILESSTYQTINMYLTEYFSRQNFDYIGRLLALLVTGITLVMVVSKIRNIYCQLIAMSWGCVVLFSTLLSLQMFSAPRYAFAPAAILLVFHVGANNAYNFRGSLRILSGLFVTIVLLSAIHDARGPLRIYHSMDLPQWRSEISEWKSDPRRPILIWPQFNVKSWRIDLAK